MRGSRRVIGLAVACLGIGCSPSDLPVSPQGETSPSYLRAGTGPAHYGSPGGFHITLSDYAGTTLTFDEATRTLSLSTGESVVLDPDAVADVLGEFIGWESVDSVVVGLNEQAHLIENQYANCNNGGPCATVRATRPKILVRRRPSTRSTKNLVGEDLDVLPMRRQQIELRTKRIAWNDVTLGLGYARFSSVQTRSKGDTDPKFLVLPSLPRANVGGGCDDFAASIIQHLGTFGYQRSDYLRRMGDVVKDAVRDYGMGTIFNRFSQLMQSILGIATGAAIDRQTVVTMGAFWNIMSCPEQAMRGQIYAGKVWQSGGGSWTPPATWVEHCVSQWWEISFNGLGGPWYPILVDVCWMGPPGEE
jgi:hypothetical protein